MSEYFEQKLQEKPNDSQTAYNDINNTNDQRRLIDLGRYESGIQGFLLAQIGHDHRTNTQKQTYKSKRTPEANK